MSRLLPNHVWLEMLEVGDPIVICNAVTAKYKYYLTEVTAVSATGAQANNVWYSKDTGNCIGMRSKRIGPEHSDEQMQFTLLTIGPVTPETLQLVEDTKARDILEMVGAIT